MLTRHGEGGIALHFDRVSFAYGGLEVLRDASFHVHEGEFVALVGPNGAGKTTILRLALGLEKAASGRITLFGSEGGGGRGLVGYAPQQAGAGAGFPISVSGVVRMGALAPFSRRGAPEGAVAEALDLMGIADLAARPFDALSGGQRRRVLVARALVCRPRLLALDEPAANMDAESEERLYRVLGALKGRAAILLVTHDMTYVSSLVDRVLCLEGGAGVIVQHRTASEGPGTARILHGESLPGDVCGGNWELGIGNWDSSVVRQSRAVLPCMSAVPETREVLSKSQVPIPNSQAGNNL
ncbi:MAG: ATP-binding cassette domain-containing protein [Treponema sp.]|jgi:zinc transport system ATP-binding protein|nr:ATP-binding cassette domain-containing protein [Treponema sp.]